jgi:hypothetical protein
MYSQSGGGGGLPPATMTDYFKAQGGYPSFQEQLQANIALMNNSVQHLQQGLPGNFELQGLQGLDDPFGGMVPTRVPQLQRVQVQQVQQPQTLFPSFGLEIPSTPPRRGLYDMPSTDSRAGRLRVPISTPTHSHGRARSLSFNPGGFEAVTASASRGSVIPTRDLGHGTPVRNGRTPARPSPYGTPVPSRAVSVSMRNVSGTAALQAALAQTSISATPRKWNGSSVPRRASASNPAFGALAPPISLVPAMPLGSLDLDPFLDMAMITASGAPSLQSASTASVTSATPASASVASASASAAPVSASASVSASAPASASASTATATGNGTLAPITKNILLESGEYGFCAIDANPNESGLYFLVVDRATVAALTSGGEMALTSVEGWARLSATASTSTTAAGSAPVSPALASVAPVHTGQQIERAKVEIEAARARIEAAQGANPTPTGSTHPSPTEVTNEDAAVALLNIATPRSATFGSRIAMPPMPSADDEQEVLQDEEEEQEVLQDEDDEVEMLNDEDEIEMLKDEEAEDEVEMLKDDIHGDGDQLEMLNDLELDEDDFFKGFSPIPALPDFSSLPDEPLLGGPCTPELSDGFAGSSPLSESWLE